MGKAMKNLKVKWLVLILVFSIVSGIFNGCQSTELIKYEKSTFVIGTFVSVTILSETKVPDEVFDTIFTRLREIEGKMTINQDVSSQVQQVNEKAGEGFVQISEDTYYVIEEGIKYSELTNGKFDITVGPLVKLWDIGFGAKTVPLDEDIEEALKKVDYKRIELGGASNVKLQEKGMIIDLGGIAKGYAADEVARIIKEKGYKSATIDVGGNIYCLGTKENNEAFTIGIKEPFASRNEYFGTVKLSNQTMVSSGIYERNFEQNGVLYHHIFDTGTGYPVENELVGVSVITEQSMKADALSTATFSYGLESGIDFVEKLDGVEAVFVTRDKKVYVTSGLESGFTIYNEEYEIKKR